MASKTVSPQERFAKMGQFVLSGSRLLFEESGQTWMAADQVVTQVAARRAAHLQGVAVSTLYGKRLTLKGEALSFVQSIVRSGVARVEYDAEQKARAKELRSAAKAFGVLAAQIAAIKA